MATQLKQTYKCPRCNQECPQEHEQGSMILGTPACEKCVSDFVLNNGQETDVIVDKMYDILYDKIHHSN